MRRAIHRHLLDRFVLRPSRHAVDFAPKERVLKKIGRSTHEYFVQRVYPSQTTDRVDRDPDLLILKFPGTAGRAERASDWPASYLPNLDIQICTWNAPGYGSSSGRASLSAIPNQALEFYDHIRRQVNDSRTRVWLVGNSLGCVTATYLSSRDEVRINGMVLRNPPPLVETVKRVARKYPLGHLTDPIAESLPTEMNLSVTAAQASGPIVMLQSEHDALVPPELQQTVFDAMPQPKRLVVLHGLGHDDLATEEHEPHLQQAIVWLWERCRDASVPGQAGRSKESQ